MVENYYFHEWQNHEKIVVLKTIKLLKWPWRNYCIVSVFFWWSLLCCNKAVNARAATVCPEKQVSRAVLNLSFTTSLPHTGSSFMHTHLLHLTGGMCWGSFSLTRTAKKTCQPATSFFVTPVGLVCFYQRTHKLSISVTPSVPRHSSSSLDWGCLVRLHMNLLYAWEPCRQRNQVAVKTRNQSSHRSHTSSHPLSLRDGIRRLHISRLRPRESNPVRLTLSPQELAT